MKKAQCVQIIALSLVILGSLTFISQISFPQNRGAQVAAVAGSSLVGYWTFDDGMAADTAGTSNGTVSGATLFPGRVGAGALTFDGVDDYVTMGAPAALDITGAVTVSAWVNLDSTQLNRKIAGKGLVGSSNYAWQYQLFDSGNSNIGFRVSNQSTFTGCRSQNGDLGLRAWHHVVGTYNGTDTVTVYVDGASVCSYTVIGFGALKSTGNFTIGADSSGQDGFFAGKVDDVQVYSRELSSSEVASIFSGIPPATIGSTPPPSGGGQSAGQPTYYVSTTGSDSNSGTQALPLKTIQKAADLAGPGTTVFVAPGAYPEHVTTKAGGISESARVTFKAQGLVTMQGFTIKNPYVTVDGFDITGYIQPLEGHVMVYKGADYCKVINNTIHDGSDRVFGIYFYNYGSDNSSANNCVVSGNHLTNLKMHYYIVQGANHVIENNLNENMNDNDGFYVFGHDHIFRRNIFRHGVRTPGNENHADFVQTFADGNSTGQSYSMLFEENWIEDWDTQLGQINNGLNTTIGFAANFHDIVFRRNVFANLTNNFNIEYPGVRFESNTFYHTSYSLGGIILTGNVRRGDPSRSTIINNAFVAGGNQAYAGFYAQAGAGIDAYTIGMVVPSSVSTGIYDDLVTNGYVFNSVLLPKVFSLSSITSFILSSQYDAYKSAVYTILTNTVALDKQIRGSFASDYNFVAGPSPTYSPKPTSNCSKTFPLYVYDFCEAHGVNGEDPRFSNINNPAGPDGIPFTLDDGLKPAATSPLCGKGYGGSDIGAYSCSASAVFSTGGVGVVLPPNSTITTTTPPPTTFLPGDFNKDGVVNTIDFSLMAGAWNTNNATYDLNKDGTVNTLDYSIMVQNWTK